MKFTYILNGQEEYKDIVNRSIGIITAIPDSISGDYSQGFYSSVYTTKDDVANSIIFDSMELSRLIDIERELYSYENKYKMKSEDFYKNWKTTPFFDSLEFNKWAKMYRFLEYAKKQ